MGRRKESITISDPRALRALAHPARQRLINELFGGRVLTATEAAELVDLTPSAVSHHLRALEKYGLAERATASNDARERPWRGTARTLKIDSSGVPGAEAAMQSLVSGHLGEFAGNLETFLSNRANDPWRGIYQGLAKGELWLTREETQELNDLMMAAIQEYDTIRRNRKPPTDARKTAFVWSLLPIGPAPD
jgi:DNA-binding transcriptional ArsR family regulator